MMPRVDSIVTGKELFSHLGVFFFFRNSYIVRCRLDCLEELSSEYLLSAGISIEALREGVAAGVEVQLTQVQVYELYCVLSSGIFVYCRPGMRRPRNFVFCGTFLAILWQFLWR